MSRKSRNKVLKKEIFIFCEGITEKIYFDLLKQKYRLPNVKVRVSGGLGQSLELVKCALKKTATSNSKKKQAIEKVLVVFDKDDEPWETIEQAFSLARKNHLDVCFSNECFELWLLAHYEKIQKNKYYDRKLLYSKLTHYLKIEAYESEKANKIIIQRIFTQYDSTETNCADLSTHFKEKNYCDMQSVIQNIFKTNI
ncbi:RloB family protein [Enterococcus faecalis]|uniref:RloB family protein n=1 Tax=Enterococcus faecalis TaxID=1351 RepID=UPI0025B094C0|nr:RloB family protein [Enterococcus faecalis]MDN3128798.1 RloB family protein [Enterococcus faecalis]